jgi:PPOX class probable F420-dependent enzyme
MTVELTHEVATRLEADKYGWLTTVAKSGQPVPKLVGFCFDGSEVAVYSMPDAAKVRHIKARPRVSLNLDSDGNGRGIIVVGGEARIDAVGVHPYDDALYEAKFRAYATSLGAGDEFLAAFSTRLKFAVDSVWSIPAA